MSKTGDPINHLDFFLIEPRQNLTVADVSRFQDLPSKSRVPGAVDRRDLRENLGNFLERGERIS